MQWIIGVDEVGRGCLAGPVMVGICAIPEMYTYLLEQQWVRDSKSISAARRTSVFEYLDELARGGHMRYVVATQSAQVIDAIGIVGAIQLCIDEALSTINISPSRAHVYLDGGLRAAAMWQNQSTHIKGDRDYPVISAASIIAKVVRDQYMVDLAQQYPQYQWQQNKGYGTWIHRRSIVGNGLSGHHRVSFCKKLMEAIH